MSAALPAEWSAPPERPLVLGHRGAKRHAPENTLQAFRLAHEHGADGVELDVMLASDGVAVCHDATLSRVTRGLRSEALSSLTLDQLAEVDVGGGHGIPSLEAVLRWAVQQQRVVNVELKADQGQPRRLAHAVAECIEGVPGSARLVLASSFHLACLVCLHRVTPSVPLAALTSSTSLTTRLVAGLPWPPFVAIHPERVLVHVESVAKWKARGLRIHTWTVNDAHHARQLAALGVDALITDDPSAILSALSQASTPPSSPSAPPAR